MHACDRQTDGRTDRITTPKTALAYARAVKTSKHKNQKKCEVRLVSEIHCGVYLARNICWREILTEQSR